MDQTKKKKIIEKSIIAGITVIVIGLFVLFLSDIFIPFIKMEIANDIDGAKEYLLSKGLLGYLTVVMVEGLQMVVVFISAEFIQVTSGISYPWWLAIILCDCGVMLGSSIIYLLVNVFKFDSRVIDKNGELEKYEKKARTKSTVKLMYILFIMPIIPFGAICYYGSSKKIPYPRYLLTCATGVIPSIISSIAVGTAIKEFITKSLPIWALILIIIVAAAVLFTVLLFVLKKFFISPNNEKGIVLFLLNKLAIKIALMKIKYRVINEQAINGIEGPFIALANHHSAIDVFLVKMLLDDKNMYIVGNEYYLRLPVIGKMLEKHGSYIRKKMFYDDISCIINIFMRIKKGNPVMIFPEGRLSTDGGPSYFNDSIAALCKKLGVPIVLIQIRNSYFAKPKWRKAEYRSSCEVEIMKVISKEELKSLSKTELHNMILDALSYNEFSNENIIYRQPNKAKGLENILYLCPHCRSMYSNRSNGNRLICSSCGKEYIIKDNYQFDSEEYRNIFEYYRKIKEIESQTIDSVNLKVPVDVKIFKHGEKRFRTDKGIFTITSEKVSYKSDLNDLYFEYTIAELEGIAYSVNKEFELYYNNELYYFYPDKNSRSICTRVALLFELMKEKIYEEKKRQAD
ncbi:MAG: 1-acyl-sn-glycerol-3-phosphate acyltransferase [Clostridiales bacterium]|nr:1-acyl-sn-glycerol-3-phosphate acyltransferase [Clostridiales bacterium]